MSTPALTITGTLQDLTGNANVGSVQFQLVGYGTGAPHVAGTNILVQVLQTATANGSGVFSINLFGNDVIAPAGTYYVVSFISNTGVVVASVPYQFVGSGAFDLSSLAVYNPTPTVPATPQAVVLNPTGIQTISTFGLAAPQFQSPDFMANGTPWYDIRSFGASTSVADNSTALQNAINAGISNGKPVFVPAGTFRFATTLNMNISHTAVRMFGVGGFGSTLQYTGTGTALLYKNGDGTQFIFDPFLESISISCGNASGASKGIESWSISEGVFRDIAIGQSAGPFSTCWYMNAANIIDIDHLILSAQSVGNTPAIGIDCVNGAAIFIHWGDFFYFPTTTMRFSGTGTTHIEIANCWFESQDIALLFDDLGIGNYSHSGFYVHNNRFLFNGAAGTGGIFSNQLMVKFNNTGTNSMAAISNEFRENTVFMASGLTSTAYPIVVSYSASTGASDQINLNVVQNYFIGASGGMVNVINGPAAFRTGLQFFLNYSVDATNSFLSTAANGVCSMGLFVDSKGNVQTLTGPSGNALSLPTIVDTLVGRTTTDTLSNKTLTAPIIQSGATVQSVLKITGSSGLPTGAGAQLLMTGSSVSPPLGTIYVGDGTGWELDFNKRSASTDTTLAKFKDSGQFEFKRIKTALGTALVAGDFALSAGFGTTATVTGVIGTDQGWTITVTSSGTGQAANPTITLTFHDGTWTLSPITVSKMSGGTGAVTQLTESPTATTNVITFQGTPVAASTYVISSVAIGR